MRETYEEDGHFSDRVAFLPAISHGSKCSTPRHDAPLADVPGEHREAYILQGAPDGSSTVAAVCLGLGRHPAMEAGLGCARAAFR
jgi:hypothetical protein